MHACAAGGAGITTALRGPSVVWFLPGLGALLDEVFFPLFGVLAGLSVCFYHAGSAACPGRSFRVVALPEDRWLCGPCQVSPASWFGGGHGEHQPSPMQSVLRPFGACGAVARFQVHPGFWCFC